MPSGGNRAKDIREAKGAGAPWAENSDGAEEPVTARVLLDNNGSGPPSDGTGPQEGRQEDHANCGRKWVEPMDSEPTPVISANVTSKAVRPDAQDKQSTATAPDNDSSRTSSEIPGPPLLEAWEAKNGPVSPSEDALPSQSGRAVKETDPPPTSIHMSCSTRTPPTPRPLNLIVSEEFLKAPTPGHLLKKGAGDCKAETKQPELGKLSLSVAKTTDQCPDSSTQENKLSAVDLGTAQEAMAGRGAPKPVQGAPFCEGDTTLIQNFLPPDVINGLFEQLCEEVHFKTMRHQGSEVPRFVAVQGTIDPDGTQPVYRHPSDESPPLAAFTPAVQLIRGHVERQLGHPVNHVLIQCYRNSGDYISEHSDKTLDIFRWSYIANVSIGAMRTMVFRTKRGDKKDFLVTNTAHSSGSSTPLESIDRAATKPTDILKDLQPLKRHTTRCPMPHNSLIKMGLVTNEKWLHGIKADKRPHSEKTAAELAWNGTRISLTFRYIVTFLSPSPSPSPSASSEPLIWGQGAVAKTRERAGLVLNGQSTEAVAMLRAFGRENNSPDFDWEANYGCGFDVLHMKAAPRYFGCGDVVVDGRVRIMLAECGVKYARGDIGIDARQQSIDRGVRGAAAGEVLPVRFVVDDADRTTVVGDVAIMLFLDTKHPRKKRSDMDVAAVYSRFYVALALEQRWKTLWASAPDSRRIFFQLKSHLTELEKWAAEAARCTSLELGVADYALWPVLHDIALAWKSLARGRGVGHTILGYLGLPCLDGYYREFAERKSVAAVFRVSGVDIVATVLPESGFFEDESDEEEEEDDVVEEDAEKKPGKGRLPKFTEFGEVDL